MTGLQVTSFPFYPLDFLRDEMVRLMTAEERGAYILLLCHAAVGVEAPGTLPLDEAELARMSRLTPERWAACREGVLRAFRVRRGRLVQKRLSLTISAVQNRHRASVAAGKRSATSRKLQTRNRRAGSEMSSDPSTTLAQGRSSDSTHRVAAAADAPSLFPESLPADSASRARGSEVGSEKEVGSGSRKANTTRARAGASPAFEEFWRRYPSHRRVKRLAAMRAFDKALALAGGSLSAILNGLEAAKREWARDEPRFVPHPTSWLNAGRWMDTHATRGAAALTEFLGEDER